MENSKEFTPKGEAEIRELVIKEYGLDENDEANKPFIEKAVQKELSWQDKESNFSKRVSEHEKIKSTLIKQKSKWRDEAKKLASLEDEPNQDDTPTPTVASNEPAKQVENEKLSALEKEVEELKSSNHRSRYPHLKDEEYNTVMSIAGGIAKFEETLNGNPIVKNYIETNRINERVAGATASPSTRTSPSATMNFDEVDLDNPSHVNWLKSEPNRLKEYRDWLDKGGSKNLTY